MILGRLGVMLNLLMLKLGIELVVFLPSHLTDLLKQTPITGVEKKTK